MLFKREQVNMCLSSVKENYSVLMTFNLIGTLGEISIKENVILKTIIIFKWKIRDTLLRKGTYILKDANLIDCIISFKNVLHKCTNCFLLKTLI